MANSYRIDGELVSADEYNRQRYDSTLVRFPKGSLAGIRAFAKEHGESANALICRAVAELMEKENRRE